MKKKLLLFAGMLMVGTVAALNVHVVKNELGDIRLQNIEMLSYGENEETMCYLIGCLDCPLYEVKVRYVW
jgi:hypothetical protein